MLAKDALEIVLDLGPGFYSRLFSVRKGNDLSHLNRFARQTPFKMEPLCYTPSERGIS